MFTIGFARRFTGYKRPDLILNDLDRLKSLLGNPLRPVQIIFAGKSHPSDVEGARIIQRIFRLAQDPEFGARIAFVEDYDQHLAQRMVRGVDHLAEQSRASSGSKRHQRHESQHERSAQSFDSRRMVDGRLQRPERLGFRDHAIEGDRTKADADAIYNLLENEIVPLYYQRADDEIPHGYVQVMKAAIKSVAPQFSTRRMVKEYVTQFYLPALGVPEPKV